MSCGSEPLRQACPTRRFWHEHRILLTFDKDFGELARGSALPRSCGVVLFRMPMPKPEEAGLGLAALIAAREDWAGNFSVIEPGRVRMRPLG